MASTMSTSFALSGSPQHNRNDTFPSKLFEILSNPEFSHIISWLPHGRTWKVHNKKEFEKVVMPKYFVMTKWSSFARQVNGWGFYRILIAGLDRDSYCNQMFSRDRPDLIKSMRRRTSARVIQAENVSSESSYVRSSMLSQCSTSHKIDDTCQKQKDVSLEQGLSLKKRRSSSISSDVVNVLVSWNDALSSGNLCIDKCKSDPGDSCCGLGINISDSKLSMEVTTREDDSSFDTLCSIISEMNNFSSSSTLIMDGLGCGNTGIIDAHKRKRFPFGQY